MRNESRKIILHQSFKWERSVCMENKDLQTWHLLELKTLTTRNKGKYTTDSHQAIAAKTKYYKQKPEVVLENRTGSETDKNGLPKICQLATLLYRITGWYWMEAGGRVRYCSNILQNFVVQEMKKLCKIESFPRS